MASRLWTRLSRLLYKKHYPKMSTSSKPTTGGAPEASTSSGGRDYPKDMIIEEHVPDKDLRSKLINTFLNLEELDPNLFRCVCGVCARARVQRTSSAVGHEAFAERIRRPSDRSGVTSGWPHCRRHARASARFAMSLSASWCALMLCASKRARAQATNADRFCTQSNAHVMADRTV